MPPTTKTVAKPRTPAPLPADLDPALRVRYFPATATVTDEIAAWAKEHGHRIRAIVPVHWEGTDHE